MQYGQQYRILRVNGEVVEGKHIQTKGNDEQYPSFELEDGSLLGVHIDAVLGPVIDDCPVDAIPRPDWETNPVTIKGEIETLRDVHDWGDPSKYIFLDKDTNNELQS